MGKMLFNRQTCLDISVPEVDQFAMIKATGIIGAPVDLTNQLWRLNNLYWIIDKKGRQVMFRIKDHQYKLFLVMWFLNIILTSRQRGYTTGQKATFTQTHMFQKSRAK